MGRVLFGMGMAVGIAGAILACGACGAARLPAPPYVMQPTEALQPADYPPPPPRVELIPQIPTRGAVWIDGEWTWQGRRWAWKTGRWVEAPAHASYSPWTTVRDPMGTLYFAEGKWRDAKGQELPDPTPLALAKVRGGAVVNAEGEQVPQTPNVRPDRTPGGPQARDAESGPPETPSGATPTGTEPKGATTHNGGRQVPEGGAPPDAGAPDVMIKDATIIDAMPLGAGAPSPRMVMP